VLCNVIANTVARVRRWEALLRPLPHAQRASFFDLARLLFAGYAFSNLLPARAGEAVRVVELHRRRGYPASGLVAVQIAEKAIETLSLGLLCGIVSLTPGPGRAPLALGGALAVCGLVLLLALPRRVPAAGVQPAPALAFALAYHAVHLVPTTALGLAGLCLPWRQS